MGLPKAHRLRNREDYRAVYGQGIRRYGPNLTLVACFSSASNNGNCGAQTKIGVSISKKVSKKAVVRNRIKRQIQNALRTKLSQINSGWNIVVIVRPQAKECKYEHFLRELEELLKQAKIINGY